MQKPLRNKFRRELLLPAVSSQYQVIYGNQNWKTSVQEQRRIFLTVRNFSMASGGFLAIVMITRERECSSRSDRGDKSVWRRQSDRETIRINKAPFRVVGVLASKGQSAMGQDQDYMVIVPLSTAQDRLMGITYLNNISIQAKNAEVINKVQEDVTALLRSRHRLAPAVEDDFTVRNMTALMATMTETTDTITLLLGNVAAISLLVGGIGIMNIMLVSVTERTREIGIRKALGATFKNVLMQFIIEAVAISVTGGLFGIAVGVVGARIISWVAGWNTVIAWWAIVGAFGVSVMIGLFFGIYPARKAALLDPIDALRYE